MGFIKEFRDFAVRGNVVDLAVGFILGGAFNAIVNSLVKDVMMPPLGWVIGGVDFSDKKIILQEAREAVTETVNGQVVVAAKALPEVSVNYGQFINAIIQFVIMALALFLLVKAINQLKRREEAKPAPPPGPTNEEKLLAEIRDLLAGNR